MHVGIVGGVVCFAILYLLVRFFLRRRSHEALFHASSPFSYRKLSIRRSYYPPSASVYSEPEMDESGNRSPGIYVRFFSVSLSRAVTVAWRSSSVHRAG